MTSTIFVLLLAASSNATSFSRSEVGTSGASFLKLGPGARAAALGEAYSAVADDADALYWNPAGLSRIEKRSVTFMHSAYLDSAYFDYLAYGQRLSETTALGAGVQYFSAGAITQTDTTGSVTGRLTPSDLAATFGISHRAVGLSIGASVKYIRSSIATTAQAVAFDAGIVSPEYQSRFRFAAAALNMGTAIKFDQFRENLPFIGKIGAAFRATRAVNLSADLGIPRDNAPFFAVGVETTAIPRDRLRLIGRAGFNSRTVGDISGFSGASFGVGLGMGGLSIDYAMVPFGGLGLTHRTSITHRF